MAQAAKESHQKAGTLIEQLQAAITSDKQLLRLPELDLLLETLEEKKHDLQQKEKENNLELLLHFLNHSKYDFVLPSKRRHFINITLGAR